MRLARYVPNIGAAYAMNRAISSFTGLYGFSPRSN
jgi:hypothetical protein